MTANAWAEYSKSEIDDMHGIDPYERDDLEDEDCICDPEELEEEDCHFVTNTMDELGMSWRDFF
jgi:hypothetical protein